MAGGCCAISSSWLTCVAVGLGVVDAETEADAAMDVGTTELEGGGSSLRAGKPRLHAS
jgi:hypothetical protein